MNCAASVLGWLADLARTAAALGTTAAELAPRRRRPTIRSSHPGGNHRRNPHVAIEGGVDPLVRPFLPAIGGDYLISGL